MVGREEGGEGRVRETHRGERERRKQNLDA